MLPGEKDRYLVLRRMMNYHKSLSSTFAIDDGNFKEGNEKQQKEEKVNDVVDHHCFSFFFHKSGQ